MDIRLEVLLQSIYELLIILFTCFNQENTWIISAKF